MEQVKNQEVHTDSVHCNEIYLLGIQKALDSSGQKVSWQDEEDPAKKHEM